jgi:hypothetical protein
MNFLHEGLILSLLNPSTLFLKSGLRSCSWIVFHSGVLFESMRSAITGSSAIRTLSGGFLYCCSSVICLLPTPCTLAKAAMSAGSALPRSFSTTILRSAASAYLMTSCFLVCSAMSFLLLTF